MRFFIFVALIGAFGITDAQDVPPYVREAEVRYKQGDYARCDRVFAGCAGCGATLAEADADESRFTRASVF